MLGKVIASSGGIYTVTSNGVNYKVFPRGIFKYKNEHLYVGDDVEFDEGNRTINEIKPRKNSLIRPRCSNIDQLIITMSVVEPDLQYELLYKFLTYANMNDIPAKVIFTKVDLLKNHEELDELTKELELLGYSIHQIGKDDQKGLDEIKESLKGKISIIMGQTGVGKSSLINLIDPKYERLIGEYSEALGRGKHQTKEVLLLPFENGYIGDTPGFSSLELNLTKEDLRKFFPGYYEFYTECFFSDCLHQNEKECRVKQEIEKGKLSKIAYEIYLKLLENATISRRY